MQKYVVSTLLAVASLASAQTAPMTREDYAAAKARIEAEGDRAEAQCKTMQGNAKEVCEEEAEGKEKVARAELEQQYKPSAGNTRKVQAARMEAEYDAAKARCGDQSGSAKKACEKEAEAVQARNKTQLKAAK